MRKNEMVDRDTKIWAAGVFEGEGSALIEKTGNRAFQIVVSVASTDKAITDPIKEIWGGHYRADQNMSRRYFPSARTDHTIYFSRDEAKRFLADIFPYLRSPRSEAKVLIVLKALCFIPGEAGLRKMGRKKAPRGVTLVLEPYYQELRKVSTGGRS